MATNKPLVSAIVVSYNVRDLLLDSLRAFYASSDVPVEVLDEYRAEYGVDRVVLVQPVYPGEDNGYVADCAARRPDQSTAATRVTPGGVPRRSSCS